MKRLSIIPIVMLLVAVSVAAQDARLSSAPKSFRTFFAAFKQAAARGEKTKVAGMTRFPFRYGFDAGDEGTMSRAQFLRRFREVFGTRPSRFVSERNPLFSRGDDGSYQITTEDAAHLIFVRVNGAYKFTAYIVEP
jgi:hypothetical protein